MRAHRPFSLAVLLACIAVGGVVACSSPEEATTDTTNSDASPRDRGSSAPPDATVDGGSVVDGGALPSDGGGGCLDGGADSSTEFVKPPVRGLMNMGTHLPVGNTLDDIDAFEAGTFGGTVINVLASQLEPDAPDGGPLDLDASVIEDALTNIRSFNSAHPATPLRARLRVF